MSWILPIGAVLICLHAIFDTLKNHFAVRKRRKIDVASNAFYSYYKRRGYDHFFLARLVNYLNDRAFREANKMPLRNEHDSL